MMKKVNNRLASYAAAAALLIVAGPLRAEHTDPHIESSIKKSYVFKTFLKDDAIKVESKAGIVTLTGTVADDSRKSLAQETASEMPGVKSVDNRLEIKGERPAVHSDAWLLVKVTTTLLFHRHVSASQTKVDVNDGVATLKGEATSQAQKDLTAEYVKDVEGIKDVKNEMTVAKAPEKPAESLGELIDDASITAQVKISLLSHRSTSALRTKVKTTEGVVTVSGQAKNPAEKDLVTKLVEDIRGVKSVVNNMTIDQARKD